MHRSVESLRRRYRIRNLLFIDDMGPAGRLAWALTAKQACQASAGETMGAAHGAVQTLHDCAVADQALMVVGVAEEHLAVQKPAAVPAAQTCAAAVHGADAVPAVHAGPVVHAVPAVDGVSAVPAGPVAAAKDLAAVQQAYDTASQAAAAAVLAGSREVLDAIAFAAGAKTGGA